MSNKNNQTNKNSNNAKNEVEVQLDATITGAEAVENIEEILAAVNPQAEEINIDDVEEAVIGKAKVDTPYVNYKVLTGGMIGAIIGAGRHRSVTGLASGVAATGVAAYWTRGQDHGTVKELAMGFGAGFLASAVVSESLDFIFGGEETDSDDVVTIAESN